MFFINTDYISDERYSLEKFMPFLEDNFDVLDSYFLENLNLLPVLGSFTITTEEYRPDLISYRIYNTVSYWSLLLLYNSVKDLDELITGRSLNYFDARDLESLFFSLKSKSRGSN